MEVRTIIKENWFTRKPKQYWLSPTLILTSFLIAMSFGLFMNLFQAEEWMTASPGQVFKSHEYWRLWTTLFAHADLSHLFSNTVLFLPLVYLLTAYFGLWLTLSGFLLGGLTNWMVLKTMPANASLLGVSGVVYWMGAVWLTLFFLIDKRKNAKARFANVLYLSLMIFIPETYKPQVSYLSHFIGFVFGIGSATIYYLINKSEIDSAQVIETIYEVDDEDVEALQRWN